MNSTEHPYTLAVLLDEVRRIDRIGQTASDELSDTDREFWISHPLAYLGDFPRPIERVIEWLEQCLVDDSGSRTVDAMMRSAVSSIIDMEAAKADIWDEGAVAGMSREDGDLPENPYRKFGGVA